MKHRMPHIVLLLTAVAACCCDTAFDSQPSGLKTAKAILGDLEITVEEDGELKALHSVSVGPPTRGTITYLAPEGQLVEKGDLLIELDPENIEERIQNAQNDLESSEKKLADSKDQIEAEVARYEVDIERKKTSLELARLSLTELKNQPLPEDLALATKSFEEAELTCNEARQRYEETKALAAKHYATELDEKQKKLALERSVLAMKIQATKLAKIKAGASETDIAKAELLVKIAQLELEKAVSAKAAAISGLEQQHKWTEASLTSTRKRLAEFNKELEDHKTYAPAAGTVVYRIYHRTNEKFQVGNSIWPGIAVIELPDTKTMMIRTKVPESAIRQVYLGKEVRVRVDTLPGEEFPARITWIDHWARDANQDLSEADKKQEGLAGHQVFDIEAEITVQDERLKPGFKATIAVPIGKLQSVTYVDKRAVRFQGNATFVTLTDGTARKVVTGQRNDRYIVILSGLKNGEEVILP